MRLLNYLIAFLLLFPVTNTNAQESIEFDQHKAFSPNLLSPPESPYRSASGIPAANYWQNKADYQIKAELDTVSNTITATVTLSYTNNSPDDLPFLWFELGQNLFREGSIGSFSQGVKTDAGGFHFKAVKVKTDKEVTDAEYLIHDTRMQIRLDRPVGANGKTIAIEFDYSFKISDTQFRTSLTNTKNGTIYEVAQWYPRVCVYDDIRGWNTLPYQGAGEYYCEYGDFEYEITVPASLVVVGSGAMTNTAEVLTKEQQIRLKKASGSDETSFIISPEEVGSIHSRPKSKGMLTWKFAMQNSRDIAWAASKAFVWDAAKINLPDGKTALAMSVYPTESVGDSAWSRSTEYIKHSIEHFSERWFAYPYPVAINVAGPVGGMEYPGLCFCSWKFNTPKVTYFVSAHEIGHNWFPMIVGSNERRYAFIDEGLNTFIDIYAQDDFNKGEFAPKRDGEYDPEGINPSRDLVPYLTRPDAESLTNLADVLHPKYSHTLSYYKSAHGLVMAREYILGAERFDYAFREFIRQWAFKHPAPNDFFRLMNNATGEDLNWYWNAWYCQTWTLDQAVTNVSYVENEPTKGAEIKLANLQQMVMPIKLKIKEENGTETVVKLPVEIWQRGGQYIYKFASTSRIVSVDVDPELELPDIDDNNNHWRATDHSISQK
ncbi:M1 family metallopeptidase [Mangrovibacterium sp.]|uniref:M1 family metallopeptidase n=1 Tax=Mangrovibacterium sp. TaxID=1961364 RepID=UPI00356509B2